MIEEQDPQSACRFLAEQS